MLVIQISSILTAIETLQVSQRISPLDTMYNTPWHYSGVGRSALINISAALTARLAFAGGEKPITSILDFGCGFGRVGRWLRGAFPDAAISVTEMDKAAADWCVTEFNCVDVTDNIPAGRFDLIWAGSVFTHLNEVISEQVLDKLTGALAPNGVLVFTSQGRFASHSSIEYLLSARSDAPYLTYRLPKAEISTVLKNYWERRFGYIDYPGQKDYGVAIVDPEWYLKHITKSPSFIRLLAHEKGWDTHQDVNAFMRAELADDRKGWYYASTEAAK